MPRLVALLYLSPIKFGERVVYGARAAVEVLALGFLGDLRQNFCDKFIGIRAALAAGDHLEGDFHGAFQLHNRLNKIDHVTF